MRLKLPTEAATIPARSAALGWWSARSIGMLLSDRRWAAPLASIALGFGLFAGVAIGPGAAGTLGTPFPSVIQIPGFGAEAEPESSASPSAAPTLASPTGNVPLAATPPATPLAPAPAPAAIAPAAAPPAAEPVTPAAPVEPTPTPEEPAEEGLEFKGTVIHVNPLAGSYALAATGGQLVSVHTTDLPAPGDKIEVAVRELFNLTYAEDGDRKTAGKAGEAKLGGTVTYQDPAAGVYTVSRKGASVLVHLPDGVAEAPPAVGSVVSLTAEIEPSQAETAAAAMVAQQIPTVPTEPAPPVSAEPAPSEPPAALPADPDPLPAGCGTRPEPAPAPLETITQVEVEVETELTYTDIEGIVQGACAETRQLVFSADDLRASGADLTLDVPEEIDLTKITAGDVLAVSMLIEEDGSLLLQGLSSDRKVKGAEDADLAQGDQAA